MPTNPEAIIAAITDAATAGFRGRLIARGQARAMIWRDGVLPPDAPAFSPQLSFDLHSYAYGLLGLGLRLLELGGDPNQARIAFEQAATALEAAMAKGNRAEADRDFHFVMAAASYHLAHLSARAYSLLAVVAAEENFSPIEQALALLMHRDITALRARVYAFRLDGRGSDATIAALFQQRLAEPAADAEDRDGQDFLFEGLDLALTDTFYGAFAMFLLAMDRGERALLDRAIGQLRESLDICAEFNLLPQWWVHRVAIHLLSDLWSNTFHEKVPLLPAGGAAPSWPSLRELFIALLARRPKGGGRPVAVTDRGGVARCRSDRQPRRFAADQCRQDPHRRIVHSEMLGRRAARHVRDPASRPVGANGNYASTHLRASRQDHLRPLRQHRRVRLR